MQAHGSLTRDGLAVALLATLALIFSWNRIQLPFAKQDETVYVDAAAMVSQGRSPYDAERYFYPPSFAVVGSLALERSGEIGYLKLLRIATLFGASLAVWFSSAWTNWSWLTRTGVGLAVLMFSETVEVGLTAGNVSAMVIGLILCGLVLWRRFPLLAASLVGVSIAIKPVAILLPPLFLVHGWRWREAAAVKMAIASGGAMALGLLPGFRFLGELPGVVSGGAAFHPRNLALSRVLYCFGLEIPTPVLALVVLGLAVGVLIWRQQRSPALEAATIVATLLALPIVWIYTLLLALPLQLTAISLLLRRASGRSAADLFAVLAVIGLFFGHATGGVETWPLVWQGLVVAVPVLSPAYLWIYTSRRPEIIGPDDQKISPGPSKLEFLK